MHWCIGIGCFHTKETGVQQEIKKKNVKIAIKTRASSYIARFYGISHVLSSSEYVEDKHERIASVIFCHYRCIHVPGKVFGRYKIVEFIDFMHHALNVVSASNFIHKTLEHSTPSAYIIFNYSLP